MMKIIIAYRSDTNNIDVDDALRSSSGYMGNKFKKNVYYRSFHKWHLRWWIQLHLIRFDLNVDINGDSTGESYFR